MKIFKMIALAAAVCFGTTVSAQETFTVKLNDSPHGKVIVTPALPADGVVAAGTVLKVIATPDAGWVFDSGYVSPQSRFGYGAYTEYMAPIFEVKVDKNMAIGASFMEAWRLEGHRVINDVVYAKPGEKVLKYDVFIPEGAKNLPGVVIIHGGGWSSNCEDIMRALARELINDGKYVVASIDYRWINNGDGDATPNTMANLIEDCYGAILHIQEHAADYGMDPNNLAVTGDSAGGHLSASMATLIERIGDGGFGVKEGVYEYKPTYMPAGMTTADARESLKAIKAAAPSYGVFDVATLGRYVQGLDDAAKKAVAPIDNIPDAKVRKVAQWQVLGTRDNLIKPAPCQAYVDAQKAKGQEAYLVMVEGASHAFFDWKPDQRTKDTFIQYGVPYAKQMKEFFNTVFYK
ncbi:MAG: alpha/beta hydrolase [Tidjanibacter sp.]|nr:alpha/beta hydrolase [Tidjanibacter sp.]